MNFSILKNNAKNRKTNNNEIFEVKKLYIATPGLITRDDDESGHYWYDKADEAKEYIVCEFVNDKMVRNVLNGREYYIFFRTEITEKNINTYMVNKLTPFESCLKEEYKTRTNITREEIINFLYPKEENLNTIKDIVLKQIKETDDKINKSSITEEEKTHLKNNLIDIARNYVETLKSMNNTSSKVINLNTTNESIINLRKETMRKLVEIEMELPPEDIDNISNELMLLEQEIVKSK